MFKVRVDTSFAAAHHLRDYGGQCENLHGHNWKVEAVVSKDRLDKAGMAMDFEELKGELKKVLRKLDHSYLNRIAYFKKANPTSENIARYIYDVLKIRIKDIARVTVWESDNSCATYYGE